jgi:hypothetical protein
MDYARSIPEIFTDLVRQLTTLMRTETQLARAEVSEKIGQVGAAIGLIIGGAVLIMPGLVVLLHAATAALVKAGFQDQWAALIVGGGVVVVGLILLAVGVNWLKSRSLVPDKTIGQVQRDASVAKKQIRNETRNDHDTIQRAA